MATVFSTATLRLQADSKQLNKALNEADLSAGRHLASMSQSAAAFEANWKDMTRGIKDTRRIISGILISQGFYALSNALLATSSAALKFSMGMESASVSLEYFVDSAVGTEDAAAKVSAYLREVNEFAARTPFNTDQVLAMSKYMQAVGVGIGQTQSVLSVITDTAAATGAGTEQLQRITFALGQMITKGRIANEEIRQLANANIPIYSILQEELGLTGEEISNIGKYWVDADKAVVAILNGLDKRYHGAADRIAETLAGMTDTIVDDAKIIANTAFSSLYDKITNTAGALRDTLDEWRELATNKGMPGLFNDITLKIDPSGDLSNQILNTIGHVENLKEAFVQLYHEAAPALHVVGQAFATATDVGLATVTAITTSVKGLLSILAKLGITTREVGQAIASLFIAYKATKMVSFFGQAMAEAAISAQTMAANLVSLLPAGLSANAGLTAAAAGVAGLSLQVLSFIGVFSALQSAFSGLSNVSGPSGISTSWESAYNDYEASLNEYNDIIEKYRSEFNKPYSSLDDKKDSKPKDKDKDKKNKNGHGGGGKDTWLASFDEVYRIPDKNSTGAYQKKVLEDFSDLLDITRKFTFPKINPDLPEKPKFDLKGIYGKDVWSPPDGSITGYLKQLLPVFLTLITFEVGKVFARNAKATKDVEKGFKAGGKGKAIVTDAEATKALQSLTEKYTLGTSQLAHDLDVIKEDIKEINASGATTESITKLDAAIETGNKRIAAITDITGSMDYYGQQIDAHVTRGYNLAAAQEQLVDARLFAIDHHVEMLTGSISNITDTVKRGNIIKEIDKLNKERTALGAVKGISGNGTALDAIVTKLNDYGEKLYKSLAALSRTSFTHQKDGVNALQYSSEFKTANKLLVESGELLDGYKALTALTNDRVITTAEQVHSTLAIVNKGYKKLFADAADIVDNYNEYSIRRTMLSKANAVPTPDLLREAEAGVDKVMSSVTDLAKYVSSLEPEHVRARYAMAEAAEAARKQAKATEAALNKAESDKAIAQHNKEAAGYEASRRSVKVHEIRAGIFQAQSLEAVSKEQIASLIAGQQDIKLVTAAQQLHKAIEEAKDMLEEANNNVSEGNDLIKKAKSIRRNNDKRQRRALSENHRMSPAEVRTLKALDKQADEMERAGRRLIANNKAIAKEATAELARLTGAKDSISALSKEDKALYRAAQNELANANALIAHSNQLGLEVNKKLAHYNSERQSNYTVETFRRAFAPGYSTGAGRFENEILELDHKATNDLNEAAKHIAAAKETLDSLARKGVLSERYSSAMPKVDPTAYVVSPESNAGKVLAGINTTLKPLPGLVEETASNTRAWLATLDPEVVRLFNGLGIDLHSLRLTATKTVSAVRGFSDWGDSIQTLVAEGLAPTGLYTKYQRKPIAPKDADNATRGVVLEKYFGTAASVNLSAKNVEVYQGGHIAAPDTGLITQVDFMTSHLGSLIDDSVSRAALDIKVVNQGTYNMVDTHGKKIGDGLYKANANMLKLMGRNDNYYELMAQAYAANGAAGKQFIGFANADFDFASLAPSFANELKKQFISTFNNSAGIDEAFTTISGRIFSQDAFREARKLSGKGMQYSWYDYDEDIIAPMFAAGKKSFDAEALAKSFKVVLLDYSEALRSINIKQLAKDYQQIMELFAVLGEHGPEYLHTFVKIFDEATNKFGRIGGFDIGPSIKNYPKSRRGNKWLQAILRDDSAKFPVGYFSNEMQKMIDKVVSDYTYAVSNGADNATDIFIESIGGIRKEIANAISKKPVAEDMADLFGRMLDGTEKARQALISLDSALAVLEESPMDANGIVSSMFSVNTQLNRLSSNVLAGNEIALYNINSLIASYTRFTDLMHLSTNKLAMQIGEKLQNIQTMIKDSGEAALTIPKDMVTGLKLPIRVDSVTDMLNHVIANVVNDVTGDALQLDPTTLKMLAKLSTGKQLAPITDNLLHTLAANNAGKAKHTLVVDIETTGMPTIGPDGTRINPAITQVTARDVLTDKAVTAFIKTGDKLQDLANLEKMKAIKNKDGTLSDVAKAWQGVTPEIYLDPSTSMTLEQFFKAVQKTFGTGNAVTGWNATGVTNFDYNILKAGGMPDNLMQPIEDLMTQFMRIASEITGFSGRFRLEEAYEIIHGQFEGVAHLTEADTEMARQIALDIASGNVAKVMQTYVEEIATSTEDMHSGLKLAGEKYRENVAKVTTDIADAVEQASEDITAAAKKATINYKAATALTAQNIHDTSVYYQNVLSSSINNILSGIETTILGHTFKLEKVDSAFKLTVDEYTKTYATLEEVTNVIKERFEKQQETLQAIEKATAERAATAEESLTDALAGIADESSTVTRTFSEMTREAAQVMSASAGELDKVISAALVSILDGTKTTVLGHTFQLTHTGAKYLVAIDDMSKAFLSKEGSIDAITTVIKNASNNIAAAADGFANGFEASTEQAISAAEQAAEVQSVLHKATFKEITADFGQHVTDFFGNISKAVNGALDDAGSGILGSIKSVAHNVSGSFKELRDALKTLHDPILSSRELISGAVERWSAATEELRNAYAVIEQLDTSSLVSEDLTPLLDALNKVKDANENLFDSIIVGADKVLRADKVMHESFSGFASSFTTDTKYLAFYYDEANNAFRTFGDSLEINGDQLLTQMLNAVDSTQNISKHAAEILGNLKTGNVSFTQVQDKLTELLAYSKLDATDDIVKAINNVHLAFDSMQGLDESIDAAVETITAAAKGNSEKFAEAITEAVDLLKKNGNLTKETLLDAVSQTVSDNVVIINKATADVEFAGKTAADAIENSANGLSNSLGRMAKKIFTTSIGAFSIIDAIMVGVDAVVENMQLHSAQEQIGTMINSMLGADTQSMFAQAGVDLGNMLGSTVVTGIGEAMQHNVGNMLVSNSLGTIAGAGATAAGLASGPAGWIMAGVTAASSLLYNLLVNATGGNTDAYKYYNNYKDATKTGQYIDKDAIGNKLYEAGYSPEQITSALNDANDIAHKAFQLDILHQLSRNNGWESGNINDALYGGVAGNNKDILAMRLAEALGVLNVKQGAYDITVPHAPGTYTQYAPYIPANEDAEKQLDILKQLSGTTDLVLGELVTIDGKGYYEVKNSEGKPGAFVGGTEAINDLDMLNDVLDMIAHQSTTTGDVEKEILDVINASPVLKEAYDAKYGNYANAQEIIPELVDMFNKANGTNYTVKELDAQGLTQAIVDQAVKVYEAQSKVNYELAQEYYKNLSSNRNVISGDTSHVIGNLNIADIPKAVIEGLAGSGIHLSGDSITTGTSFGQIEEFFTVMKTDRDELVNNMKGFLVGDTKDLQVSNLTVTAQDAEVLAEAGIKLNADGTMSFMYADNEGKTGNEREITLDKTHFSQMIQDQLGDVGINLNFTAKKLDFTNFDKVKEKMSSAVFDLSDSMESQLTEPMKQLFADIGVITDDGFLQITNKAILNGEQSMTDLLDNINWDNVPDVVRDQMYTIAALLEEGGGNIQDNIIEWANAVVVPSPIKEEDLSEEMRAQLANLGITFRQGAEEFEMVIANTGEMLSNGVTLIDKEKWDSLDSDIRENLAKLGVTTTEVGNDVLVDVNGVMDNGIDNIIGLFIDQPEVWDQIPDTVKQALEAAGIITEDELLLVRSKMQGGLLNVGDDWITSWDTLSENPSLKHFLSEAGIDTENGMLQINTAVTDAEVGSVIDGQVVVPFDSLPQEIKDSMGEAADGLAGQNVRLGTATSTAVGEMLDVLSSTTTTVEGEAGKWGEAMKNAFEEAMKYKQQLEDTNVSNSWQPWNNNTVKGNNGQYTIRYGDKKYTTYADSAIEAVNNVNQKYHLGVDYDDLKDLDKKASGGTVTKGLTLAGELGNELAVMPNGKTQELSAGLYNLPVGTEILNAEDTAAIKKYAGKEPTVQKYAAGTATMHSFLPDNRYELTAALGLKNGGITAAPTETLLEKILNKIDAIVETLASGSTAFATRIAEQIYTYIAPLFAELTDAERERVVAYVGTLIADDRGLRELQLKLNDIQHLTRRGYSEV